MDNFLRGGNVAEVTDTDRVDHCVQHERFILYNRVGDAHRPLGRECDVGAAELVAFSVWMVVRYRALLDCRTVASNDCDT